MPVNPRDNNILCLFLKLRSQHHCVVLFLFGNCTILSLFLFLRLSLIFNSFFILNIISSLKLIPSKTNLVFIFLYNVSESSRPVIVSWKSHFCKFYLLLSVEYFPFQDKKNKYIFRKIFKFIYEKTVINTKKQLKLN